MKSGYELFWSERASTDLQSILKHLSENWSQREMKNFSNRLDSRINLIVQFPNLFPSSGKRKSIKRSVLTKHITIYYQVNTRKNIITILSLFDTRQNPNKLKL